MIYSVYECDTNNKGALRMAEVEDPPVLMEGAATERILNDSLLVASGLKSIYDALR